MIMLTVRVMMIIKGEDEFIHSFIHSFTSPHDDEVRVMMNNNKDDKELTR